MMRYINIRKLLGIIATISGIGVLITSMPSWIWMMASGAFLVWFGWILYNTSH